MNFWYPSSLLCLEFRDSLLVNLARIPCHNLRFSSVDTNFSGHANGFEKVGVFRVSKFWAIILPDENGEVLVWVGPIKIRRVGLDRELDRYRLEATTPQTVACSPICCAASEAGILLLP
jgi:hypothetical protein